MPKLGPVKRNDLIRSLKKAGFQGPYAGGKHQFMVKSDLKLALPNPHQDDISRALLAQILKQAGIEKSEWERL